MDDQENRHPSSDSIDERIAAVERALGATQRYIDQYAARRGATPVAKPAKCRVEKLSGEERVA